MTATRFCGSQISPQTTTDQYLVGESLAAQQTMDQGSLLVQHVTSY
jgi:hypothetical protein